MSSYSSCPHCGRKAKESFSSNWFPVYKCNKCGEKFCKECAGGNCPGCGSTSKTEVGKVYA